MVRYSKDKEGIPPDQPKELATHLVPRLRGSVLILVKTLLGLSITLHSAPASVAEDFACVSVKYNIVFFLNRVFIADAGLWPLWLYMVKGMGEAEDMPLSIPRETLLRNKVLRVIKQNLVKKRVEMSPEIHEKKDGYKESMRPCRCSSAGMRT